MNDLERFMDEPPATTAWEIQLNLNLAVWRRGAWDTGMQVLFGFEAMHQAAWYRPDGQEFRLNRCVHDFTAPISASPLPCHQPATHTKGCFSDHFALIKCSCHNSGCEDACKTFLPRQNKAEKLFRKELKALKPSQGILEISPFVIDDWKCSIATQIKSRPRLKKDQPSQFCSRKHLAN